MSLFNFALRAGRHNLVIANHLNPIQRALSTSQVRFQQRLLVVADHNNETITPITFNAIAAANKIGGSVEVLLITNQPDKLVNQVEKAEHVSKVLVANHTLFEQVLAERMAPVILNLHNKSPFTHIIAGANSFGANVLPRVAAKLNVRPITGVIGINAPDTFLRPIYGGQAIQTYKSKDGVKIFTARATAFQKVEQESANKATVEQVEVPVAEVEEAAKMTQMVGQELNKSERPDLTSASRVVSGGRGLKSKENFELVFKLAEKLGAAVGASRAAVDAGYVPNDMQVGQTGKMIAPELYVAVGISGAIQHLSGMKDSKTIVAINKDSEAPIFQVADLGLEADLFKAVPEMTEKL
uniref:Electron transfer flavoprotein subunit alpha n=1 Tax=Aceria tosichella TaxID=561515 RepID=A0A6G1SRA1_9ACAR